MNDKIAGILGNLSARERQVIKLTLLRLKLNDTHGLDIKRLDGHGNLFRVRKDRLRILYYKSVTDFRILRVDRRGYKGSVLSS